MGQITQREYKKETLYMLFKIHYANDCLLVIVGIIKHLLLSLLAQEKVFKACGHIDISCRERDGYFL